MLLETIKHLSRNMYNFQLQLHSFKTQLAQSKTNPASLATRVTHTMRQLVKALSQFTEAYPYRADEDIFTDKLCFNFYKQLNLSVKNYAAILGLMKKSANHLQLNHDAFEDVGERVSSILDRCDVHFVNAPALNSAAQDQPAGSSTFNTKESSRNPKSDGYFSKIEANRPNALNVIRTSSKLAPKSGVMGLVKSTRKRTSVKLLVKKRPNKAVIVPSSSKASQENQRPDR